jgi:hypothetical protein
MRDEFLEKYNLSLRNYQPDDLNDVVDLYVETWGQDRKYVFQKTNWAFNIMESRVLLLFFGTTLIAVRAGFTWPLIFQGKTYKFFQLHGTCVHSDWRRKGIFSYLTNVLIHDLKLVGYQGIFNVSVMNSRLGYEKLGWRYMTGFETLIFINRPIQLLMKIRDIHKPSEVREWNFRNVSINFKANSEQIVTKYTDDFVNKRILAFQNYGDCLKLNNTIIVYKVVQRGRLKELVLGSIYSRDQSNIDILRGLYSLRRRHRPDIISYIGIKNSYIYKVLRKVLFLPKGSNSSVHFGIRALTDIPQEFFDMYNYDITSLDIDTF